MANYNFVIYQAKMRNWYFTKKLEKLSGVKQPNCLFDKDGEIKGWT